MKILAKITIKIQDSIHSKNVSLVALTTMNLIHIQRIKLTTNSMKPPPCVVDQWAGGSLTRRLTVSFAVSWSRQLGDSIKLIMNAIYLN